MSEAIKAPRWLVVTFWIFTVLFCLEMSFTAWWELTQVQQSVPAFTRLGFPSNAFRIELSWLKVVGVLALLLPMVPARGLVYVLKEWAYCGFALNLASALIAHTAIHDIPAAFAPSSITSVLWLGSYVSWRRMQTFRVNHQTPSS
jgi:hypothetical protein